MYLLDTNIASETDPYKSERSESRAIDLRDAETFLSTITVAEVRSGILRLVRQGASAKAGRLETWWSRMVQAHGDRILAFDLPAAEAAAAIRDRARAAGHDPGWADIQIAGIAQAHGLTILTRNVRHFAPLGVPFIDPFAPA